MAFSCRMAVSITIMQDERLFVTLTTWAEGAARARVKVKDRHKEDSICVKRDGQVTVQVP